jgi:hypothetical protein
MQFNNTSSKNGIIQQCETLCNLGDGGITSNTTLLAKFTEWVNQACLKVESAIISVDKNWKWDDYNYSDFSRATANLVSGQRDYTLPAASSTGNASELLRVNKIAVLDTNSTPQERTLIPTNLPEADLNNIYSASGLPVYYKLIGNSVKMWPAPSSTQVTLTGGLIVYFQRTHAPFTTSDTTKEPGFPETYHDLVPLYASSVYLLPINTNLSVSYLTLFNQGLEKLQEEYTHRNDDNLNQIRTKYRNPR